MTYPDDSAVPARRGRDSGREPYPHRAPPKALIALCVPLAALRGILARVDNMWYHLPAMSTTSSKTRTDKRKAKHRLNTQQRTFVLAVLDGANNTEAARRANYKHPKQAGSRLLTNVAVAAAVEQGRLEIALRGEVTQDWLVEREKEILAYALTPVRALDRYGKPTGPEMRQLSAANTAVFNIAKLTGHWIDKRADMPANLAEELFEAIGARPMKLIEHEPED